MGIDLPLCSEDIDNIIQIVTDQEQLINPKIVISAGSKTGEGYLGINCSVEVSDKNKKLHLFIKAAPKLVHLREKAQIRVAFQNEYRFYTSVHPIMEEFYKSRTGKSLEFIPKFYAGSIEDTKEIFVMENLKEVGFDMNDANNSFDTNQVLLIMKQYGRLHGISFALKDQRKEVFSNLAGGFSDLFYLLFDSLGLSQMVKSKCKTLEKYLQSPDDAILLEKVKFISENVEDIILKFKDYEGDHRAILHGDCNHNNLMFRTQENCLDLRLLDFQGVRYNSPVLDISYLIYADSSSKENLAQLDNFLNAYYISLSNTITELGSDPEQLCPMSVIREHWHTFSVFGLIMSLLILGDKVSDEVFDMVEIVDRLDHEGPSSMTNEEEYARRVKYLLQHFVENKFI